MRPAGVSGQRYLPAVQRPLPDTEFANMHLPGDGTVYIKENRANGVTWQEADDYTAASFFMLGDTVSVQR